MSALNSTPSPEAAPPVVPPHVKLSWWRNKFLTGIFVVVPVVATIYILRLLFKLVSGVCDPLVRTFVHYYGDMLPDFMVVDGTIPFAALFITLALVMLVGILATNVFGKKIMGVLDQAFHRIPLVNIIYPLIKQVMDAIKTIGDKQEELDHRQVVYLKYPGTNGYLLGFLTGRFKDSRGRSMATVFIPTAPNPITGFVLVFHTEDIIESDLSMDDAWKMVVSAGFIVPSELPDSLRPQRPATAAAPFPVPADTTQTG